MHDIMIHSIWDSAFVQLLKNPVLQNLHRASGLSPLASAAPPVPGHTLYKYKLYLTPYPKTFKIQTFGLECSVKLLSNTSLVKSDWASHEVYFTNIVMHQIYASEATIKTKQLS